MTLDPMQSWLNAAGKYPLLPKQEILRLAKKRDTFEVGSPQYIRIVNKICQHNLKLIPGVVRSYIGNRSQITMGSDVTLDLLQQGYIGLRRAAEKFDATKGYTFSTYAFAWIRQSMSRWYGCNERAIYIPENCLAELIYIKRNGKRSGSKNGRIKDEVLAAARRTMDMTSVDTNLEGKGDREYCTVLDIMSDSNRVISTKSLPEGTGMQRIAALMVECDLDLVTREIIKIYGRRGRMSVVASRMKMPQKDCTELYNKGMAILKAKFEEKQACKAQLVSDRLKRN